MKRLISVLLSLVILISTTTISFSAITYRPTDSYTVSLDTPTCEEAIVACGGSLDDTQRIYFQLPKTVSGNEMDTTWINHFNSTDLGLDYCQVCAYWWQGFGSKWPDGTGISWVGYRTKLVDIENRIYEATIPNDTSIMVWNNGVNGGMDNTKEVFYNARQLKDSSLMGASDGDYNTLPEGSPNSKNMDGCIQIINYNDYVVNPLTGVKNYGAEYYVYYGDGCYGYYPTTSDNFYGKYAACMNPEHHHINTIIGYDENGRPIYCKHENTYTVDENYVYHYNYEYSYDTVTVCTDCNNEISRINHSETCYYHNWNTIEVDENYQYYDWGYTYDLNTKCSVCKKQISHKTIPVIQDSDTSLIFFDATSAGWKDASGIMFYIREIDGTELATWRSKKLVGTKVGDGIWAFDAKALGVVEGKQYSIVFGNYDTDAATYDLLLDSSCFGELAYANPDAHIENPIDCTKSNMLAKWEHNTLGPQLQITSIGNVVGETCPLSTTPYALFVDFLTNKLENARVWQNRTDQNIIDSTAKSLNLTDEEVDKAIRETGVKVEWKPKTPIPDQYGYVVGSYYLTGSINGDNSGTSRVHKNLRFEQGDTDYSLSYVKLSKGDKVNIAVYRGNNVFIIYPDGTGQEKRIDKSGYYTFYFKPYEIGNPNYWYFNPPILVGEIVGGILGDTDGSGNIEVTDATFIQRWLAKIDTPYTKAELMRGDVDESGDLELTDVTWLQYYLANMRTPYQIGITK